MKKITLLLMFALCGAAFFSACSKDDDKKEETPPPPFKASSYEGSYSALETGEIIVVVNDSTMTFPVDSLQRVYTFAKGDSENQIIRTAIGDSTILVGNVSTNGNVVFEEATVDIKNMLSLLPLSEIVPNPTILGIVKKLTGSIKATGTGNFSNGNKLTYTTIMTGNVSLEIMPGSPMSVPVTVNFTGTAVKK